jgi:hypothetical protein
MSMVCPRRETVSLTMPSFETLSQVKTRSTHTLAKCEFTKPLLSGARQKNYMAPIKFSKGGEPFWIHVVAQKSHPQMRHVPRLRVSPSDGPRGVR